MQLSSRRDRILTFGVSVSLNRKERIAGGEIGAKIHKAEIEEQGESGMMATERSMEEGIPPNSREEENGLSADNDSALRISVPILQKITAEIFGTYFIVFAGCSSVIVNKSTNGTVTFPGICLVWGLAVTVMIYSVGHISGAHFNPAVTISFASCRRFPWKLVPVYITAQVFGSTLAISTLRILFGGGQELFAGTIPKGSNLQSLVLEFIISFYLMFVICGVSTDNRAIGELAGIAVGSTVLLNVGFAGPISGASMNPARSLGPAIIANQYKSLWVYMIGPICGMIVGAWAYNIIRYTDKSLHLLTKNDTFLKA